MAEFHQIAGYDVISSLGQGAASRLYAVRDKHGQDFCLKRVVKKSPAEQRFIDQAVAEYKIAKEFDSPMLRRVHDLIRQRNFLRTNEVLVVMELVDGRTLEQVKFNGAASYCKLMHAVAKGLKCMHDAGYVHADIKPNNIMIDKAGMVKLIDFGQSCTNGTVKERIQGTPDYIAPEQVQRRPITFKTDIFNLGATMYWLLTGNHVPTMIPRNDRGDGGIQLRSDQSKDKLATPMDAMPDCPPALSNLVMQCIARKEAERPASMQEVMDRAEIAAGQANRMAQKKKKAEQSGDAEPDPGSEDKDPADSDMLDVSLTKP